jgi:hypothetical protein
LPLLLAQRARSVLLETSIPDSHRYVNPPSDVPVLDDDLEQQLLDAMPDRVNSSDLKVQLDWAEDALRHCAVATAHRARSLAMNRPDISPEILVNDNLRALTQEATKVVKELQKKKHGRAYFLNARYILPRDEKFSYYELAACNDYSRAYFYLGQACERLPKHQGLLKAVEMYGEGRKGGDAACLFVSLLLALEWAVPAIAERGVKLPTPQMFFCP